jgi:uncharacterized damage-inducible protein DinB
MLAMIRDLFRHQAYADASMINAIKQHEIAAQDREIRTLLHHILAAHRFWIHLSQGFPLVVDDESVVPASLETIAAQYRATQMLEQEWLARIDESDLARTLESPYFPGRRICVGEALMQVCLRSQGHRSQCAVRLRLLGGEPPPVDYMLWLKDRHGPVWPELANLP